ncbi:MAG: BlaI/MecI/CopY family transcriptional regulator [Peptoniphilaceae bacterium]
MKKIEINLTDNELQIMNILWNADKALTRGEIIELIPERTWADPYIHTLLNALLKKKAIKVDSIVQTTKNFGRTYMPIIKKSDYEFSKLQSLNINMSSISNFISLLVKNNKISKSEIDELQDILDSYEEN